MSNCRLVLTHSQNPSETPHPDPAATPNEDLVHDKELHDRIDQKECVYALNTFIDATVLIEHNSDCRQSDCPWWKYQASGCAATRSLFHSCYVPFCCWPWSWVKFSKCLNIFIATSMLCKSHGPAATTTTTTTTTTRSGEDQSGNS